MKAKIVFFLSSILILVVYSSEINFMPNYIEKSDSWLLFYWIMTFYTILVSIALLNLFFMIKNKKIIWKTLVIIGLSLLSFGILNNPKSNSKEIGYIGFLIIVLYFGLRILKKPNEKIH